MFKFLLQMRPCNGASTSANFDECGGKYCSFDSDCSIRNFCCPRTRKCIQIGMYDPCEVDDQCPEHAKCHPLLARCYPSKSALISAHDKTLEWDLVDGRTCRTDAHCHRDFYCNNGACVPLPVLFESCHGSGSKCKRPFICSAKDKTCRMPCWNNFDCSRNYKWWKEARTFEKEGKVLATQKRLDYPGAIYQPLIPMAEGGQGFCCGLEREQATLGPAIDFSDTMGYDWCNFEGNYCDAAPGSTSFKLISLALIPLALVLGIFIFSKLLWTRSRINRVTIIEENASTDTTAAENSEKAFQK